jgi:hypothetical protein
LAPNLRCDLRCTWNWDSCRKSDGIWGWRQGFDSRQRQQICPYSRRSKLALGPTQPLSSGHRRLSPRG